MSTNTASWLLFFFIPAIIQFQSNHFSSYPAFFGKKASLLALVFYAQKEHCWLINVDMPCTKL